MASKNLSYFAFCSVQTNTQFCRHYAKVLLGQLLEREEQRWWPRFITYEFQARFEHYSIDSTFGIFEEIQIFLNTSI